MHHPVVDDNSPEARWRWKAPEEVQISTYIMGQKEGLEFLFRVQSYCAEIHADSFHDGCWLQHPLMILISWSNRTWLWFYIWLKIYPGRGQPWLELKKENDQQGGNSLQDFWGMFNVHRLHIGYRALRVSLYKKIDITTWQQEAMPSVNNTLRVHKSRSQVKEIPLVFYDSSMARPNWSRQECLSSFSLIQAEVQKLKKML